MNPERPVAFEIVAVMLVAFIGLIARGRWRLSFVFPAYLAFALAVNFLLTGWEDRFFTRAFYLIAQSVFDILKLALVLEVAWRTFRVFPGAKSAVRKALLSVIATTAIAVAVLPTTMNGWDAYQTAVGQVLPLVLNGTIWMIGATLAVAFWYRVPVHPFHAAVLMGFALYLACFSSLIHLLVLHGFDELRVFFSVLDRTAYLILTCSWAYLAWRRETPGGKAYEQTLAKLQLRAASCV